MSDKNKDPYDLPKNEDKQKKDGYMPFNDLELMYMTTTPSWGREATDELDNELLKDIKKLARTDPETGEQIIPKKALWGVLSYYTRDLRLGNLTGSQLSYCQEWLDYAGACIRRGYKETFLASLSRVITMIELSQSHKGFLRRRQGTITREDIKGSAYEESSKRKLTGGIKD